MPAIVMDRIYFEGVDAAEIYLEWILQKISIHFAQRGKLSPKGPWEKHILLNLQLCPQIQLFIFPIGLNGRHSFAWEKIKDYPQEHHYVGNKLTLPMVNLDSI